MKLTVVDTPVSFLLHLCGQLKAYIVLLSGDGVKEGAFGD